MSCWYFPFGKDIEKQSANNASIEHFKDTRLESLGKEICQNSLDAINDEIKPVQVIFEDREIDIEEIPGIEAFKNIIIPLSRKTWIEDKNAQNFIDTFEKTINKNKVRVLRISDYNTRGLEINNWESLIEKAGTSHKNNVDSAGSFGIGKAAPFANSNLRMVFYNTKLKDGEERSIGVNKFISYDREDMMTTQGVGYLGKEKKIPFNYQNNFGFSKRKTPGTDLYIIGFTGEKNWEDKIIASLLENFMISIYNEKLIINVEGQKISKNTMEEIIFKLNGKKYDELKNYYGVLTDKKSLKIKLDERFERYGFNEDDGYLLLSTSENANRSVLMTRKAGMKIYDRKGISGSIQFNGVFQATGSSINEMLKIMENPSHNIWKAERYEKDPKKAEDLLKDIYRFCKDNILKNYREKIEKQVNAFGISDFLPNKLNEDKIQSEQEEGLLKNIEKITIREIKSKTVRIENLEGDDFEEKLKKAGIIEGDEGGSGTPKNTKTKDKGGENLDGIGEDGFKNREDYKGKQRIIKDNNKFKNNNKFEFKIFETNYEQGEYRMALYIPSKINKLKIVLNIIGESGYGYDYYIENVMVNEKYVDTYKNSLIIEKPNKGLNIINFKVPYKNRVKMAVDIYENR